MHGARDRQLGAGLVQAAVPAPHPRHDRGGARVSRARGQGDRLTTTYLEDYLANQPIAQAQMLSFVSEGVFERLPDPRVMVTECGFAWLPTLLWRFDMDWKGVWREVPWVKDLSSEYVGRHYCLTTAPEDRRGVVRDTGAAFYGLSTDRTYTSP